MNSSPIEANLVEPTVPDALSSRTEEPRPLWHMPLHIRNPSLSILAVLASLYTLGSLQKTEKIVR